jgi:hypothetical protein
MNPPPIRTRSELERAIRDGEMTGARLMAGASFGSKAERALVGSLLYRLAGVARRAFDPDAARSIDGGTP